MVIEMNEKFVNHIKKHLDEDEEVMCKICDKTIYEIGAEEETDLDVYDSVCFVTELSRFASGGFCVKLILTDAYTGFNEDVYLFRRFFDEEEKAVLTYKVLGDFIKTLERNNIEFLFKRGIDVLKD